MRAARLTASRKLDVLQCLRPSLDLCPPGAVLVRIRYASVCGSDMPLWKADPMPTPTPGMPSAQVAFDGFCGHEVVGEIMESKSEQFAVGSLSAPSPPHTPGGGPPLRRPPTHHRTPGC